MLHTSHGHVDAVQNVKVPKIAQENMCALAAWESD